MVFDPFSYIHVKDEQEGIFKISVLLLLFDSICHLYNKYV